jgi:heat shock protein 4
MSVVGLDVGNDTCCIALARNRGIDVIMNKESKRETPACVSFTEKQRFLGTDADGKLGLSPKQTPHQLKRLIGKKFADPGVQADIQRMPFEVSEGPDGGCLVTVMYQNERASFTPEQLVAMVLVDLKAIAEKENGSHVTDCVISVPCYYDEAERYAMLDAARIAGLHCLRLMNETTATALSYGIFKTDLPETDPVHVAFVDIGHSSMQARDASGRAAAAPGSFQPAPRRPPPLLARRRCCWVVRTVF